MRKTERKTKRPASQAASKSAAAPKVEAPRKKPAAESEDRLSLSEIKQLIELVSDKQFNEFELERGDFRLRLLKGVSRVQSVPTVAEPLEIPEKTFVPAAAPSAIAAPQPAAPEENLYIVTSPIVGTFYRSPSPTAAPFVNVGDSVDVGKVLCIIEAMKLMNEIQSDASGKIEKIFVENGQPVEFGQALFGIKK